jgi:DUF1009 family protein
VCASLGPETSDRESRALGIIAGSGLLPLELIHRLQTEGRSIVVAAQSGHCSPEILSMNLPVIEVKVGQLRKILHFFSKQNVKEVVFVGGISRRGALLQFRPDWLALRVLWSLNTKGDDALLRAVTTLFESKGFTVRGVQEFISDWVVQRGNLVGQLGLELQLDAKLGWRVAEKLGELDIGQSVSVSNGIVVAVEGLEGTAALIQRTGELISKPAVLVKRAKPKQDMRLDMPTVGPDTIVAMDKAGVKALVLEAERVLCIEPQKTIQLAQQNGIAVVAW